MANQCCIEDDDDMKRINGMLTKAFQSSNINILIGSGASHPAVALGGSVEQEIETLLKEDNIEKADRKTYEFLAGIQKSTNLLLDGTEDDKVNEAITNYKSLIKILQEILDIRGRRKDLLSKRANIFTTNYDLLIERAAEELPSIRLNDGFNRTPSVNSKYTLSPQYYFTSTFNSGNLYNYTSEIPSLNLIKLHGSLSWKMEEEKVVFHVSSRKGLREEPDADEIKTYNDQFAVVLPQKKKFQQTVMERIYYDLLRIYSNELDKENTLLIAFGFSFADEHICEITKRALKNPTLMLKIFSYSHDEIRIFADKFVEYNNVEVIGPPEGGHIDYSTFNNAIRLDRGVPNQEAR